MHQRSQTSCGSRQSIGRSCQYASDLLHPQKDRQQFVNHEGGEQLFVAVENCRIIAANNNKLVDESRVSTSLTRILIE